MTRYVVEVYWGEMVPAPRLLTKFWFFEMLWHVFVYRRRSLTTYHNATSEFAAKLDGIGYVMKHMPGPQRYHRAKAEAM